MFIQGSVLWRTVRLCSLDSDRYGTGFIADVGDHRVLVTANHITTGDPDESFELVHPYSNGSEREFEILARASAPTPGQDVATFRLPRDYCPWLDDFPVQLGANMPLTAPCAILGFPFAHSISRGKLDGAVRPLPTVMMGAFAGTDPGEGETPRMILDVDARPGFSGGPVVAAVQDKQESVVVGFVIGRYLVPDLDDSGALQSERKVPSGLSLAESTTVVYDQLDVPLPQMPTASTT